MTAAVRGSSQKGHHTLPPGHVLCLVLCLAVNSVPKTHVHPGPQNVILFRNRKFAGLIS